MKGLFCNIVVFHTDVKGLVGEMRIWVISLEKRICAICMCLYKLLIYPLSPFLSLAHFSIGSRKEEPFF